MNRADRERLRQELLEHVLGCHDDPGTLERRIAEEPEVRELHEEAKNLARRLQDAAREAAPPLVLRPPANSGPAPAEVGRSRAWRLPVSLRVAAAIAIALGVLAPLSWWGMKAAQVRSIRDDTLRLVVSGPPGLPDAASASFRVETWTLEGEARKADVEWAAYDGSGGELARTVLASTGTLDFELPAMLEGVRALEVTARAEGFTRTARLDLAPDVAGPLVHLTTDKPAYQPGEVVFLRAVLLDRLSLEPRDANYRFRVVDSKGAPVLSQALPTESGVAALMWQVPADGSGGEFVFELRDAKDEFTVESRPFLVRRYQPPRLAKELDLDRETYAPGESGSAELFVERVEGGVAAGAAVVASLVVDGAEVWSESGELGADGRAVWRFTVPEQVERGEARFLARVTDGGVVETAVEPFVVPIGKVEVEFYPEGGDLVAGVENRVYAEVCDLLGRPISARGFVEDETGRKVGLFETQHQGRARFVFEPEPGQRYRLRLDAFPDAKIELPACRAEGVVLRAGSEVTAQGAPLAASVHAPGTGPWIAGVFCRGVLVAQDAFRGEGWHDLSIDLPEPVAGVLRLTVFDADLRPVAERLVRRESGRALAVAIRPDEDVLLPGGHQGLEVEVRDETGAPVAAVVGLTVTDRSVRDMTGEARIGLADQTWLVADVEELEDVEEFLAEGPEAVRNVDLLLGTRGWRRFAWLEPEALIAAHGEPAKRLLVREGRPQMPVVTDTSGDGPTLLATARYEARKARETSFTAMAIAVLLLVLYGLGLLFRLLLRPLLGQRRVLWPVSSGALSLASVAVVLVALIGSFGGMDAEDAPMAAFAPDAMPRGEVAFDLAAVPEDVIKLGAEWGLVDGLAVEVPDVEGFERLRALGYIAEGEGEALYLHAIPAGGAPKGLEPDQAALGDLFFEFNRFRFEDLKEELADDEMGGLAKLRHDAFGWRDAQLYSRVYAHQNQKPADAPRTDFTETVYWNALLQTDATGRAWVEFDLSDSVTTWNVEVDVHGASRVGQGGASFEAVPPLRLEAKLPVEVSEGDRLELPVAVTAGDPALAQAQVAIQVQGPLTLVGEPLREVPLTDGRGRARFVVEVTGSESSGMVALVGQAGGWTDRVGRGLRIVPRGFPRHLSRSGRVTDRAKFLVPMPEDFVEGSLHAELKLYPSPLADLLDGLDGLLREPNGCFEQASSSNYPNVLALAYLEAAGADAPAAATRARGLIERGYAKITGYECSEKGYEWFGGDPGHEALTAYGLLEFHDMQGVHDVDEEMVARTRQWLVSRRDGEGGFQRNDRALDSFGRAPQPVTDAYVTYALAVTGEEPANIEAELDRLEGRALESDDPYEVAVAACALHEGGRAEAADAAREGLKNMQQDDGGLVGTTTSITSSGGRDLAVETTSFAILAWLADPDDAAAVQRAVEFLLENRSGGRFGATQATIMALKALTAYAQDARRIANAGSVVLRVDGVEVDRRDFAARERGTLEFRHLEEHLAPGLHEVVIELAGDNDFPWAFDLEYHAHQPADDPDTKVAIETTLDAGEVEEGRPSSLHATIRNVTNEGLPMVVAVLGLPAGLEVPTEVLEDLQEAGRYDFWEIDGRELCLYWRGFAPEEAKELHVDLVARIPGTTTGPASRTWLYYTPQSRHWSAPLTVEVTPAR